MGSLDVRWYPNLEDLVRAAANLILKRALACVKRKGIFTWVLSGGQTPRSLYRVLGSPPFCSRMPWEKIHIFWGDERCVSLDHPWSNFRMAQETLLMEVDIPLAHLHPVPVEERDPRDIAEAYEEHLRRFWGRLWRNSADQPISSGSKRFPCFDLFLLGVGTDGHTASLFPGDKALLEADHWVAAVSHPKGNPAVPRVTMTLPVLNSSHTIMILVSGSAKLDILKKIFDGDEEKLAQCPIAMVRPRSRLFWLIEKPEASRAPSL